MSNVDCCTSSYKETRRFLLNTEIIRLDFEIVMMLHVFTIVRNMITKLFSMYSLLPPIILFELNKSKKIFNERLDKRNNSRIVRIKSFDL